MWTFCVGCLFSSVVLNDISSLAIILLRKRAWMLYFNCVVAVSVLCLFITVPWVGLQSVIVVYPGVILTFWHKKSK